MSLGNSDLVCTLDLDLVVCCELQPRFAPVRMNLHQNLLEMLEVDVYLAIPQVRTAAASPQHRLLFWNSWYL